MGQAKIPYLTSFRQVQQQKILENQPRVSKHAGRRLLCRASEIITLLQILKTPKSKL
jgi:hypothetical protein